MIVSQITTLVLISNANESSAFTIFSDVDDKYMNTVFKNLSFSMQYKILDRFKFNKYSDFLKLNLDKKIIILQKFLVSFGLEDRMSKSMFLQKKFSLNAVMSEKVLDYKTSEKKEKKK